MELLSWNALSGLTANSSPKPKPPSVSTTTASSTATACLKASAPTAAASSSAKPTCAVSMIPRAPSAWSSPADIGIFEAVGGDGLVHGGGPDRRRQRPQRFLYPPGHHPRPRHPG